MLESIFFHRTIQKYSHNKSKKSTFYSIYRFFKQLLKQNNNKNKWYITKNFIDSKNVQNKNH